MKINIKIKIKKLNDNAVIPSYSKDGDAGMDMVAIDWCDKGQYIEYKTGISVEIPIGYVGLIYPRSSISKTDLILCNSVGVIDSGYRGEITARFKRNGDKIYEVGDKIMQLMVIPYPVIEFEEVSELSDTTRGVGGYGSTGR